MKVFQQSTFERWPFEDDSVQAIITSPPYFALRKYNIPDIVIGGDTDCKHEWFMSFKEDKRGIYGSGLNGRDPYKEGGEARLIKSTGDCVKCGAWRGQHGLEPTIANYIDHTLIWAKEAYRVLRDDGIFFMNLGDSYGGSWGNYGARAGKQRNRTSERYDRKGELPDNFLPALARTRPKCKLLIPHRVAIALCDEGGWILRNDICWAKNNQMPESIKDRFSKKFEYIFMFVKNEKYFFNLDAVRVKTISGKSGKFNIRTRDVKNQRIKSHMHAASKTEIEAYDEKEYSKTADNSRGKNPSDVWIINSQPSPEKHYAQWPEKLVERMLLCSTKPGAVVVDPFCGSGTTIRIAEKWNRIGYGIDLGYRDIQGRKFSGIQKELLV